MTPPIRGKKITCPGAHNYNNEFSKQAFRQKAHATARSVLKYAI